MGGRETFAILVSHDGWLSNLSEQSVTKANALVLVTTSFPIRGDGSEAAGSFVSDLADEMAQHLPVRVVAPGPRWSREINEHGVEVFRFAAPEQALSTLRPWHPLELIRILQVLRGGARATRAAVAAGPTAHILALWALPSGHWARSVAELSGVPYSVWTLGSDIWTWGRIPLVREVLRRVLADAHSCYSDGVRLAEDTRRIGNCEVAFLPSTRNVVGRRLLPVRVDPPFRLIFLGRWHANKGIDLLIEALRLLDEATWRRIECIDIYGGGPLEDLVRAGVESLRAMGRPVEQHGYLDKPAAEAAIIGADFLLIPSRVESIPLVFSDAVKLGCPVIVTPVGDLPHLVSAAPSCGIVAANVSAADLANALAAAVTRSPKEFAEGIQRAAALFELSAIVDRLLATTNDEPGAAKQGSSTPARHSFSASSGEASQ